MRAIITVIDSINQTTMPYNEFVLYRNSHYLDEKQIILLTGNEVLISKENIPNSIEIHKVGKNPISIRRELKRVVNELVDSGYDYVIHLHSIRGSFSTILAMIGLKCRLHTVYTIHSTFTGYRFHNKVLSFFDAIFSNYVTFVSSTSYKAFPSILKKVKKSKMIVIPNGVNVERIDRVIREVADDNHRKDENFFDCVYVARMVPLKNHIFLVELASKLEENIRLFFVGEEETDQVRCKAKELGVENKIKFLGLIPREDVYRVLLDSDLYISSSTLEGLPVSVLEGMYCGLPVVLSDIPQHQEIINGITGLHAVDFDIEKWSKIINDFSKKPLLERERLGKSCKDYVASHFSLCSMHEKYEEAYIKVEKGKE